MKKAGTWSPSVWGAWIEITFCFKADVASSSPSVWGAWIEMSAFAPSWPESPSPSVWGAWIEIGRAVIVKVCKVSVALRMGGVD